MNQGWPGEGGVGEEKERLVKEWEAGEERRGDGFWTAVNSSGSQEQKRMILLIFFWGGGRWYL